MQTSWALLPEAPSESGIDLCEKLEAELKLHPLIIKLLLLRGIGSVEDAQEFLTPQLTDLEDTFSLPGIREAKDLILRHVKSESRVMIHGDYDVDGVTSTAVLSRTLERLGMRPDVYIPHRVDDGYGLCNKGVEYARIKGSHLLIATDCGVCSHTEIQAARDAGIDVIVIDHHKLSSEGLPLANAIVHPSAGEGGEAFKDHSAVGLCFKLSQALLGNAAYDLLDLVALGTVGDLAPLLGENRIFVKYGIERLEEGSNPGLKALRESARLRGKITSVHLAFILGPRINASGRMGSAEAAYRMLVSSDPEECETLASALENDNRMRQRLEQTAVRDAIRKVEGEVNFSRDRIIVVWDKKWHHGVIGIVAARLVEKYHRPAIVIRVDEEGVGKGSARSIKGVDIYQSIERVSSKLIQFGGHAQAAGITIKADQLSPFKEALNQSVREDISPETLVKSYQADCEIGNLSDLSPQLLEQLSLFGPFGFGNRLLHNA